MNISLSALHSEYSLPGRRNHFIQGKISADHLFHSDLYHTNTAVKEIVRPVTLETDAISVFVLQDGPAQEVADIEGYTIGILSELDRENTDYAVGQIEEQAGFSLQLAEYTGMDALIDALRSGEIGGMLVNHSLLSLTEDMEGYEDILTEIRADITISIQQEVEQPQGQTA